MNEEKQLYEKKEEKIKFNHKMVEFNFEPNILIKDRLKKVKKHDRKLLDKSS